MPKIASGVSTERSLFSVRSGNHLPPFPHSYKHSPSIVNPTHTRCAAVSQGRDGCSLLRGAFENDLIAAHGTSLCVVHRFAWNTLSVTITCRGKPGSTLLGPEATLNTHTHTLTHTHSHTPFVELLGNVKLQGHDDMLRTWREKGWGKRTRD